MQLALASAGTGIVQPTTVDTGAVNFDAQSWANLDRRDEDMGYKAMIGAAQFTNKVIATPAADYSAWVDGALSYANETAFGAGYNGSVFNLAGGLDYRFRPDVVAGLSLGYEGGDFDTRYNLGELESDGFLIGPYASYELSKGLTLNGSATYGRINYDVTAFGGASTGEYDANRYTLTTGLSGNYRHGAWRYRPDVNVAYLLQQNDGYTDSLGLVYGDTSTDLGRLSGGADIGYAFTCDKGELEPFVTLRGELDFIRPDTIQLGAGRSYRSQAAGAVVGGGLNILNYGDLNGSIRATYDGVFRDTYNGATIQANLSGTF